MHCAARALGLELRRLETSRIEEPRGSNADYGQVPLLSRKAITHTSCCCLEKWFFVLKLSSAVKVKEMCFPGTW